MNNCNVITVTRWITVKGVRSSYTLLLRNNLLAVDCVFWKTARLWQLEVWNNIEVQRDSHSIYFVEGDLYTKAQRSWKLVPKVQVSCTDSLKLLVQSVTNRSVVFCIVHTSLETWNVCYFWQEQEEVILVKVVMLVMLAHAESCYLMLLDTEYWFCFCWSSSVIASNFFSTCC